jgi:hypothetical protein
MIIAQGEKEIKITQEKQDLQDKKRDEQDEEIQSQNLKLSFF